jgi:YgiT-type zinc finger domain-containing protein
MNRCSLCEGELEEQMTTFVYEEHGQVWVVRNVPAFVCRQCGEKEYSPETTRRILALVKTSAPPVEILHVPAYDLAVA